MSNEVIVFNTLNEETRMLSARELHEKLGVGTRFDTWFGRLVEDCQFSVENGDFIAIAQKRATAQGNMTTYMDYDITLDVAKEACMLCRNDYGKSIRRYFIDIEKEWRKQQLSSPIQRILNNSKDQYEASLAITEMLKIEHEKQLVLTQQKEKAITERAMMQEAFSRAIVSDKDVGYTDFITRLKMTTQCACSLLKELNIFGKKGPLADFGEWFKTEPNKDGFPARFVTPLGQEKLIGLFNNNRDKMIAVNGTYRYLQPKNRVKQITLLPQS